MTDTGSGGERLPHLMLQRDQWQPERRRIQRLFQRPVPAVPKSRSVHSLDLAQQLRTADATVARLTQQTRIDPARLRVLTFGTLTVDPTEILENRFQAVVVDQQKLNDSEGNDAYRIIAQLTPGTDEDAFEQALFRYGSLDENSGATLVQDLVRFFDGLVEVGDIEPELRIGPRIRSEGLPIGPEFYLDVDLWHPGDRDNARALESEFRHTVSDMGGSVTDSIITNSLLLVRVRANQEVFDLLKELPIVAKVDLPARIEPPMNEILMRDGFEWPELPLPSDDSPLVTVIDSGVVSGHPLLRNWIVDEYDFDTGSNTSVDEHGHGTAVASLVIHGSVHDSLVNRSWSPRVRVCSAKVLVKHEVTGDPVVPEHLRLESVVEKAIRHFHETQQCRVFSMSIETREGLGESGRSRQNSLSVVLDELARELDIVVVVLAGNAHIPVPDDVRTRDQIPQRVRDLMLCGEAENQISSPGTAVTALTVGSITRSEGIGPVTPGDPDQAVRDSFVAAKAGSPSPFSRVGPGFPFNGARTAVKPDVVQYGGSAVIVARAGGEPRWYSGHALTGEPVARMNFSDGRFLTGMAGTSMAVPQVAHQAATLLSSLESAINRPPTANLVRALVGGSTALPPCGDDWFPTEDDRMRLVGYGHSNQDMSEWSSRSNVRLIAEDVIVDDQLQVYTVVVPEAFIRSGGQRTLAVSLAYDPPVRASRRDYLARTLSMEVFHGLTWTDIERYRARIADGAGTTSIPSRYQLALKPPKSKVEWSTLQVRSRSWTRRPSIKPDPDTGLPTLYFLITSKKNAGQELGNPQRFALVVNFRHADHTIDIYQQLRESLRVRETRVRIDSRTR